MTKINNCFINSNTDILAIKQNERFLHYKNLIEKNLWGDGGARCQKKFSFNVFLSFELLKFFFSKKFIQLFK